MQVVDEQWVQPLLYAFLSRDGAGPVYWYPHTLQRHRTALHYITHRLILKNTIPSATGHPSDIQQLRAVDHVVVRTPHNSNSVVVHSMAYRVLVLPVRGYHAAQQRVLQPRVLVLVPGRKCRRHVRIAAAAAVVVVIGKCTSGHGTERSTASTSSTSSTRNTSNTSSTSST